MTPVRRRICFVTGTRAEFGLMASTLRAIQAHPKLELQLVVTGMHLSAAHGRSVDEIRRGGWRIDATVPWRLADDSPGEQAAAVGRATAALATTFATLKSDVVLVVGDRVEAFAAASAGAVGQRVVAHVHGGDRAAGQVDDALRHAITKLAHVHFPATPGSAARIVRLGEDPWRVRRVGAPGLDGIAKLAATPAHLRARFPGLAVGGFALVVLHPTSPDAAVERGRANDLLDGVRRAGVRQVVVVCPNSDPGSAGIARCWTDRRADISYLLPDVPRDAFVGLMRRCTVMVGNSSAGIIEAGALGTPVVDVGDRQRGRERGGNVATVGHGVTAVARATRAAVRAGRAGVPDKTHPYGGGGAGRKIAAGLAGLRVDGRLLRKLIAY